jgi:hypothetical protein
MEVDIATAVSFQKIAEVCNSLRFVVLVGAGKLLMKLLGPDFSAVFLHGWHCGGPDSPGCPVRYYTFRVPFSFSSLRGNSDPEWVRGSLS